MIIGTAGHIDHGKTTLVRALTGVDTDRLKEEKARGISIELGYAYTPLGNGDVLGYVDVPGHEQLVHTMVAGACGIDFALLVIAADDGVMPQTREHLAVLELLGVTRGAVALTKADRVDVERLRQVQSEIAAVLASTSLSDAPVFPLNATAPDDSGTASLRRYLHGVAEQVPPLSDQGLFRLAVDRVFTLTGHGTVVTGTVFSGQIHVGDTVSVMPHELPVRVRSIHAQNRASDSARAGQRCALNLAGIEKSAISRGDWLADPRGLAASTHIDARLRLLASNTAQIKHWSPVHIHLGTTHCVAHVVLLESETLAAGESSRAQLVCDMPICARAGDRFIVRDAQAVHTIGGGLVLDPFAPSRKRRSANRIHYLDAIEQMIAGADNAPLPQHAPFGAGNTPLSPHPPSAHNFAPSLQHPPSSAGNTPPAPRLPSAHDFAPSLQHPPSGPGNATSAQHAPSVHETAPGIAQRSPSARDITPLLQYSPHGVRMSHLVRLTGQPAEGIALPNDVKLVDAGHERFILLPAQWHALKERAITALRDFHAQAPDEPGPDVGRLRRITLPTLSEALWRALIDELAHERAVIRSGPWLHLPEHTVTLSETEEALARKLRPLIAAGRFDPPWVRDLAASVHEPEDRVRHVLRKQVTQGTVYQVVHDLFYDSQRIGELADIMASLAREHGSADAARYRDAVGLGRKRTIQILEFFDRIGYSRRIRDSHVLRADSGWRGSK